MRPGKGNTRPSRKAWKEAEGWVPEGLGCSGARTAGMDLQSAGKGWCAGQGCGEALGRHQEGWSFLALLIPTLNPSLCSPSHPTHCSAPGSGSPGPRQVRLLHPRTDPSSPSSLRADPRLPHVWILQDLYQQPPPASLRGHGIPFPGEAQRIPALSELAGKDGAFPRVSLAARAALPWHGSLAVRTSSSQA